ncbi:MULTISPECIES: hypothetical protein [Vibrio]|uniref:CD-NTase-associated protein 15 domain-containing protein n=2 Tax=Vibrio cyclitrophicus TaxID=47951 RepID=A0A7Z1S2K8_9VIBR|nr:MULTISPECIES: hypothetical protein [Vibrio]PMO70509.1 hypothetical protein BCT03_22300 [Vibrio splendidus]PMP21898.1 hypothetical protein BCS91_19170 [Vibrio cyclitrophicus]PMP31548.1 hypothetical protein BCS90_11180 [Vibrio cyclitrophicus]
MNQTEVKLFSAGSILIGATFWVVPFFLNGFEVLSFDSLKYLNLGVTMAGLFWFFYFKWAWKWSFLRKILYRPNLNGTWLGEFESDWTNELGEVNPPKRFVLVIRQHWFTISVRAFTSLQKTESYVETLMIDDNKGAKLLAYLFSEKRAGAGEHGPRQGAAELDLVEASAKKILEGHFWTQAGTRGYIRVKQISDSVHMDSFEQAESKWPDNDHWKSVQ